MARMKQLFVAALLCCIYQMQPDSKLQTPIFSCESRGRAPNRVVNPDL